MTRRSFDVAIVGGGIMGSSIAYNLQKRDPALKVIIFEKDFNYKYASTPLSLGNLRVQFDSKANIQIAMYGLSKFERFPEEMAVEDEEANIDYHRDGNLFLWDEARLESARQSFNLQTSMGARVIWLDKKQLAERYGLFDLKGVEAGTFGADDGHLDPYLVLMAYRRKAKSLGVLLEEQEVAEVTSSGGSATGVRLKNGEQVSSGCVVNCAGPWAAEVAATTGVDLPIVPVKRQCFAMNTAVSMAEPLHMVLLPSGLFFRSESVNQIFLGKSLPEDVVGFDFNWQQERFMEVLWPEIAAFVPAFNRAKLARGWAGLYAVNQLDNNAVLGEWPLIKNLFLANGFSGHGVMQAPAVGRYISELVLGHVPKLDLSVFAPERLLEQKPVHEQGII